MLRSIPRAWKFSFTWAFLLSSSNPPWHPRSMKILQERSPGNRVTAGSRSLCELAKAKGPQGPPAPGICSTQSLKPMQTPCSSCPWPPSCQTSPNSAPAVPGKGQLQEHPKLPDLFWPLVAPRAPESNASSSSWLQAKLQITLKWCKCHKCISACSAPHYTHKPRGCTSMWKKKKKKLKKEGSLPSYVILSNSTVQLPSEDLSLAKLDICLNSSLK